MRMCMRCVHSCVDGGGGAEGDAPVSVWIFAMAKFAFIF